MITMQANEIDDETLAEAEREAMQQPSDSAMWDERLYETHAPVMSWAKRGDDLLEESNYRSALRAIIEIATLFMDESWADYARSLSNPQTETLPMGDAQ